MKPVNLLEKLASVHEPWQPECITTVDDMSHSLKIAKFKGSFDWHSHPNTDETFYCVSGGPVHIDLNTEARTPEEAERNGATQTVELNAGDIFCVRKNMQHRPRAEVEAGVLMFEKVGTSNVGDNVSSSKKVHVQESGQDEQA